MVAPWVARFVFHTFLPILGFPFASETFAERQIAAGEVHADLLDISASRFLLVTVEQRTVDVVLAATGADGRPLGDVDGSADLEEIESLLLPEGTYRLEVRAASPALAGRYAIRIEELTAGTPEKRRRIEAERLATEAGRLRHRRTPEFLRSALPLWAEAREHWRALGEARREARALHAMAEVHRSLGEARPALDLYGQALDLWTSLGRTGRQADTLTAMGLAHWSVGETEEALAHLQRALEIRRSRGDRSGEAGVFQNICLVRHTQGAWREAVTCYEQALALLRAAGNDPGGEAAALGNLGGVYDLLGEPLRALDHYGQALARMRALGNRKGEAQMLNNLGAIHGGLGEPEEALGFYQQALALFRELGDRSWEARVLSNLGSLYRDLGEAQRSIAWYEQALALRRELGDRRGEAATLDNLGLAWQRLGEVGRAKELFEQALAAGRVVADRQGEATSLRLLAQAHLETGGVQQALDRFAQAIEIQRSLGDRRGEALALHSLGEARARLGQTGESLACLEEALALRRALLDRAGEAQTLTALARVERGRGRLEAARHHTAAALEIIESLRTSVVNPDLRATFLSSLRQAYELEMDLLMEMESREPGRGHAEAALVVSERSRARTLLELLRESGAGLRQGLDPELREREREVSRRLHAKARRQIELAGGRSTEDQRRANETDLRELLAEADRIETEIRRASPRSAALTQAQPLDAAGIRGLLDPETLLLEYSLGDARSFLWAVTPETVTAFVLPGRHEIEELARRVVQDLRTLNLGAPTRDGAEARHALGRILLGPVAGQMGGRRLAIVADGALQYVPFAALPLPGSAERGSGERFLLESHEIVLLPSASVLSVLRQELAGRPPAPATVAILADPVFQGDDPRVPPGTMRGGSALGRLPASRREAEAIAALVPADGLLMALDFRTSRATVLGGELARYRILHFATHGIIDSQTPALSGLVLSLVDERGAPQDGFLGLDDIYNLELNADLVVLSGCETGLGREIQGEGLLGLTRGFFHAGAERIVASLWRVQDQATAELMARLYQALLREGQPPAAALRQAQLSILGKRRWRDPYYWAPFILQGDWH